MSHNRDFKGVWIDKEIYLNEELSWTEKILLIEIDSLDNDIEKGCFASNEYLGNFLGVAASTVANLVSKLKKLGYINQVFFDGRNRGLRVIKGVRKVNQNYDKSEGSFHENGKAAFTKTVKQLSRKSEHINKEYNNTDINTNYNSSENEKSNFKKWTLEDFQNEIRMHRGAAAMSQDEAMNFYNYWSEFGNGKMRFQLEKTWEMAKRMATWQSRARTPINGQKSQGKTINAAKDYVEGLINE